MYLDVHADPIQRFMSENPCLWAFCASKTRSPSLFARCCENRDEADSTANLALVQAARDFARLHAPNGVTGGNWRHFRNYCYTAIWHALQDTLDLQTRDDEPAQSDNLTLVPECDETREILIDVSEHLAVLTTDQRTVVEHWYGIGDVEQLEAEAIGVKLGLGAKAVRDMHTAAIVALRGSIIENE